LFGDFLAVPVEPSLDVIDTIPIFFGVLFSCPNPLIFPFIHEYLAADEADRQMDRLIDRQMDKVTARRSEEETQESTQKVRMK
jgi:hypothetical protein